MADKMSRDEFQELLEDMLTVDPKNKLAKEYLAHLKEQEKTMLKKEKGLVKQLTAHELSVKLTEMLDLGSQIAAGLKVSTELPFSEDYKQASEEIKKSIENRKADLGKFKEAFKDWYIETAHAIARYEKNTYHLYEFIRYRDSYVIVTKPKNTPEDLLADFGHHIQELVKILQALEREDTTLTISLGFYGSDRPKVIVGDELLYFKPMRNGNAYTLISFCLQQQPTKLVTIDDFKNKHKLAISGLSNINQALKNSPFDNNKGFLRVFVESSPHSLKVNPTINVTPEYLDMLRDNAVELPQND